MSKLIRAAERRISEHEITYLLLWTGNRANLSMGRKCKEPQGEKMSSISDQHALQRKIKLVSAHIHRLRRHCVQLQVKNGLVRMMLKGGKNLRTNFILMNKLSSLYDIFLFIHPLTLLVIND